MNAADKLDQIQAHHAVVAYEQEHGEPWGDIYIEQLEQSSQDVPALVNALRAVLDLHREASLSIDGVHALMVCDDDAMPYPCPTVQRIASALVDAS